MEYVFAVGGILVILLCVLLCIYVNTRITRLAKPLKEKMNNHSKVAAKLAAYFGTWRPLDLTGDAQTIGRDIADFLDRVPGGYGAKLLRDLARFHAQNRTFPPLLPKGEEFESVAAAIGDVCSRLSK